MSLFSWNQYKGYFTWAAIYGVRERVFKVQSFVLPLYRPAGKLTPLQVLQTVHWVECLSTCRCRYHVVYYPKLKESGRYSRDPGFYPKYRIWQNAKFIDGVLDFTAARASGWAEVLARATVCGFGVEIQKFAMRESRRILVKNGRECGIRTPFQALLLLFMRVNDTYDRNTCLKESKRLALSTLDDMCL